MHGHWQALAALAISTLFVTLQFAISDESGEDLLALAKTRFDFASISSAKKREVFEEFFKNVQEGKVTNFLPDHSPIDDVELHGREWGEDRTIESEWISWVCSDPIASQKVPLEGVNIYGAKIDGAVDLSWLKIHFPLNF
jgi:hypothetical protein